MTSANQSPFGSPPSADARPQPEAVVSYRLARQRLVDAYGRGERSEAEVCDAQPELRRVAHNWGQPMNDPCPICTEEDLVSVTFAFGVGLPKAGRAITTLPEAQKVRKRGKPSTWYAIEVCRRCWWNHLRESRTISG